MSLGRECSNCGRQTLHETPTGLECSNCGYTMEISHQGRGYKCHQCNNWTVRDVYGEDNKWKCTTCGARYSLPPS